MEHVLKILLNSELLSRKMIFQKGKDVTLIKYNTFAPKGYNLSTGGIGFGNLGRNVVLEPKKMSNHIPCLLKLYQLNLIKKVYCPNFT